MDLQGMTEEQIKALAFDQTEELARIQNNLNILRAELARRQRDQAAQVAAESSGSDGN